MKSLFLLASLLLLLASPCFAGEGLSFETEALNSSEATRPVPLQLASTHQVGEEAAAQANIQQRRLATDGSAAPSAASASVNQSHGVWLMGMNSQTRIPALVKRP